MLDQSIASGPDSPRVPEPQVLVGHSVCKYDDHETLKEWIRFARSAGIEGAGWLPSRARGWFATMRPWPEAGLLIGECPCCHSSLAICVEHEACDGTSDDHDLSEGA